MRADITQPGGAQQRVGDGVQQHIGIRMPQQPGAVGDLHAAQHQPPSRHQRVDVPALSNSEIHVFFP